MNRCLATISLSAFSIGVLVVGCQKPADQQSSPDANAAPSMADAAKTAVKKVIEPKPLVIPADTVIGVVLDQTISSKTSKAGDKFTATVESPIEIEGKVAIPKGARAEGVVNEAKAAGRFKGGAALSLTLTSVTVNGKDHEIQTSGATISSKGKGKRTAAMVGGGAAGGAAIGDRKSTRLNSSHGYISYAVFCLKKKKHEPCHAHCSHYRRRCISICLRLEL